MLLNIRFLNMVRIEEIPGLNSWLKRLITQVQKGRGWGGGGWWIIVGWKHKLMTTGGAISCGKEEWLWGLFFFLFVYAVGRKRLRKKKGCG